MQQRKISIKRNVLRFFPSSFLKIAIQNKIDVVINPTTHTPIKTPKAILTGVFVLNSCQWFSSTLIHC